jgi:hypothetical protein
LAMAPKAPQELLFSVCLSKLWFWQQGLFF